MREYKDYIRDMVEAIDRIVEFTKDIDKVEDFGKDDKTIFAVIRALEIVGEAAKNIPANIKNRHKQIPWRQISGMRDKLIHEYFGINIKVIWRTIKEDIIFVKPLIEQILKSSEL